MKTKKFLHMMVILGLLLAFLPVMSVAAAPAEKVDICHSLGNGGYILINISENALQAHLDHGDGLPGEAVPGMEGKIFGADCSLEEAPVSGYGVAISGALNYSDGGFGGWSVPEGMVVLGGGFLLTGGPAAVSAPGTPGSVWPHYTFGVDEYGWVVRDAQDGAPSPGSKVFAIYADEPAGYEVVKSSVMSFGDGGYGGWSCPAGKVVLGGGFDATAPVSVSAPGTPGSVWPHYTFGTNEYGWVVRDAQDGASNTITVYAVCADPVPGYEVVDSGEMSFSDTGYGGWSCPTGKVVTGGGFASTGTLAVSAPGTPDSVWPHYTFGPDEYGWVLQDAPNGAGSSTTVYAVCAAQ